MSPYHSQGQLGQDTVLYREKCLHIIWIQELIRLGHSLVIRGFFRYNNTPEKACIPTPITCTTYACTLVVLVKMLQSSYPLLCMSLLHYRLAQSPCYSCNYVAVSPTEIPVNVTSVHVAVALPTSSKPMLQL